MKYSVPKHVLCWAITASVAMGSMPVTALAVTDEVTEGTPIVETSEFDESELDDISVSEEESAEEPVEFEIEGEEPTASEPVEESEEETVEEETEEESTEEAAEEETEEPEEEAVEEETEESEEAVEEEAEEETTEEAVEEESEETFTEEELAMVAAVIEKINNMPSIAEMEEAFETEEDYAAYYYAAQEERMEALDAYFALSKELRAEVPEELAYYLQEEMADAWTAKELAEQGEIEEEVAEEVQAIASKLYDTSVSEDYFKVISEDEYKLAPGAIEQEIILNNAEGTDRKVFHVFEVDTKNEDIEVLPGYYGIDKLDPDNLALDGIVDKAQYWKAKELTQTVKYYEGMGYNVVGAMNTALSYDSDAPYGYMVWDGVVLGTPEVHKGAQTYLVIDWEGNCELRSMSDPLTGEEKTAISANFNWLVKDGKLVSTSVERTSSDASRSMIGIKADGTLVFCQVDGRNDPISSGLSNYEMGEAMLALGCVTAVNCDGGGSSTFVSKRAGETVNTMRSVPSDGAERPTINSVILVSTAGASGKFDEALIETEYNYIAPGASMAFEVKGLDTKGFTMDIPTEVTYQVAESGMGTIADGIFTAGTTGTATIQAVYNGEVVGEKVLNVVDPDSFGFAAEETVLPYGKSMDLKVVTAYGEDDWAVCVDGVYTFELSDTAAATLDGGKLIATTDETIKGVDVTVTYTPDNSKTGILKVTYGKGSEILFDFEDGAGNFLGMDEMYDWAEANGAPAPIQTNSNYSEDADSEVFLASAANGQVKNGEHALGVTLNYKDAQFAGWSYNMFFHVGDQVVLRDVANGMNATTLGVWVYIPEGAAGLAMQIQGCSKPDGTGGTGAHFYFTTTSGAVKNLNSCTEADIPASRWVYATVDLTQFRDYFATYNPYGTTGREPSFIRFYVKPNTAQNLTFYFDDFTLDYSSAVDDRIAPKIENIEYATADTAISWETGEKPVITAGSVAFTAKVSDNIALNTESAQIYVDGNFVETAINGKTMTASANLTDGYHIVTFEIADTLGNCTQISRELVVNQERGIVYIDGHNDSGEMPEYDSVYYVDIKTSDAANVKEVNARIQLNTANTWELEQMIVAPGYEVEYEQLDGNRMVNTFSVNTDIHSIENAVDITLTRKDDCTLTGEQTLLSMPVRLWSWNGVNHVTGEVISPEAQFATGYCPVVSVEASIIAGMINDEETFGGSISVATKINDTVYPWHYHDAELTVLSKEATCTEDGYENRTYCETCKSVVDWGRKVVGGGHTTYKVDGDELKCVCGHIMPGNGIVEANGKLYCLIAGKLVVGWQNVSGKWCYVDANTKEVKTGTFTVNKTTYTADENGFVVNGAWVTDAKGTKYSYGPAFYTREWVEIEGNKYYFGTDSYIYKGIRRIPVNRNNLDEGYKWYEFAEDGKFIKEMIDYTGIVNSPVDGMHYVKDGMSYYGGLMLVDGDYYYARTSGEIVCGKDYYITKTNDLMPVGTYTFDADGKMNNPLTEEPEVKNGIIEENGKKYYYVEGCKTYGGLLYIDGVYYYARTSGEIVCGKSYYITKANDLLPVATYAFDEEGKMVNPPIVGKIIEEGGKKYWYVHGEKTYGGLLLINGDYYYARTSGEIVCSKQYWVTKTNDLLPATYYTFDADGKMIDSPTGDTSDNSKNGIFEENGKKYWYVDGVKTYGGLMLIDGDYYYARTSGEIVCGKSYYITKANDLLPVAKYTFDEDGKMVR